MIFVLVMFLFIYYFFKFDMVLQNENEEKKEIFAIYNTILPKPDHIQKDYQHSIAGNATQLKNETNSKKIYKAGQSSQQSDCIISIPSIDLEKKIYTGSNRLKYLEQYELVTATDNMTYANGGNYIICGHASRLYGHSLNRIKEIKKNDIIYIQTANKRDKYIVYEVYYENMNNTSEYCVQTEERMLTIISCAKYISKESYIIIHAKLE